MKMSDEIPEDIRFWLEKQELEHYKRLIRQQKSSDVIAWGSDKTNSVELICAIMAYYKCVVKVKITGLR